MLCRVEHSRLNSQSFSYAKRNGEGPLLHLGSTLPCREGHPEDAGSLAFHHLPGEGEQVEAEQL